MRSTFFLLIPVLLTAVCGDYTVRFGWIGTVGEVSACLERDAEHYHFEIQGRTVGVAKRLSGDRRELFISQGRIVNDRYVPQLFAKRRQRYWQTLWHYFVFAPAQVTQHRIMIDHIRPPVHIDPIRARRRPREREVCTVTSSPCPVTDNDLLTLYLNRASRPTTALGITPTRFQWFASHDGCVSLQAVNHAARLSICPSKDALPERIVLHDVLIFGDLVGRRMKDSPPDP